jgi:ribonuclease P protein component
MLAKENRLLRAEDFRATMKNGRKHASANLVVYSKRDSAAAWSRFGFVVAKSVGGAVTRNLVKRRLRALARPTISTLPAGTSVVVRALPGSATLDWNTLSSEFNSALAKSLDGR